MELNLEGVWDTHLHCFDPVLYPLKSIRSYTPAPAPLEALIKQSKATRLVLVQASIEDGFAGLLDHLRRIRTQYPHVLARGIVCMDDNWERLTHEDFDTLHNLGVRYIRIHGFFGEGKPDSASLQEQIRLFAQSYPARQWGWGLSAQLPLATWAFLKHFLLHDPKVSNLQVIADHVGCASPTDIGGLNLDDFVQLLQAGNFNVKISALYRRSGECMAQMEPIVKRFAESAPSALVWGSDWPHVDSTNRGMDSQAAPTLADPVQELALLQSWLSSDQFRRMMVDNPERIFGR